MVRHVPGTARRPIGEKVVLPARMIITYVYGIYMKVADACAVKRREWRWHRGDARDQPKLAASKIRHARRAVVENCAMSEIRIERERHRQARMAAGQDAAL